MAKKKRGQELTLFEGFDNTTNIVKYLEKHPTKCDELTKHYLRKINDTIINKKGLDRKYLNLALACYEFKNDAKGAERVRNITYEGNHRIITACIHNHLTANRCFPIIESISKETGLSRTTIYNHLKDGLLSKDNALVKGKLEYMVSQALSQLYLIGVEDSNANALKHFIELSGAINKSSFNTVNNYIQINNLKITREQFEQLPEDVILEVEQVISKSLKC